MINLRNELIIWTRFIMRRSHIKQVVDLLTHVADLNLALKLLFVLLECLFDFAIYDVLNFLMQRISQLGGLMKNSQGR